PLTSGTVNHLKVVATLLHEVELLDSLVLCFLFADVPPDDRFVPADGRNEVTARPEVLPHEVAPPVHERPRNVDGALALDEPDDVRNGVLRRDRDEHVHVVGHQVALLDSAFLLLGERPEDRTKVASKLRE